MGDSDEETDGIGAPSLTMKIKGTIELKEVIILVDIKVTHNFLSLDLVQRLALPLTTTTNYRVVMGIVISVKGKGMWTLGDLKVNWNMLTMKTKMGKAVILLKDPSFSPTELSLKQWLESIVALWPKGVGGTLLDFHRFGFE
ncbi:hypothetical protein CK203_081367 [Vitis vinifera]|uniref:Ty3-gypsy retrotransposon protein n=1 Tax=Vitis vinifera TaxID=29760 RepID=A0A438CZW4_VITVI|nr:hypothetical protein CK203_081367 [Vitis vinifera]